MQQVVNLSRQNALLNHFVAEIRDAEIQQDRMRFRFNLQRIGEVLAYEISKILPYSPTEVETPLGTAETQLLTQQPVLATILRAGVPMHEGMLRFFDKAGNAFVSAYRHHHKDGSFEINVEYVSSPSLEGRPLIICDPMIATGASMVIAIRELIKLGRPSEVVVATIISAADGLEYLRKEIPYARIFTCAIDEELTAKSYIVPGLGDAGDLAYGAKQQD
jgi:uracil phosphoribosyltransferase